MKRFLVPVLAGFLAFSAVVASAATLGGLNSEALGSGDTVVVACDADGVDLAYTTSYNGAQGTYVVTAATVSDISAACVGQDLSLTVADASGATLGTGSVVVAATSETVTFAAPVSATALEAASVLVTG